MTRRLRGVATGRQAITLSLPQGEVVFDLSTTRRLRGVLGLSTTVVGRVGAKSNTLGAFTVSMAGTVADPDPGDPPPPTFVYTEAVTATETTADDGRIELLVTAPAHLATYDAGEGSPGLFAFSPDVAAAQPVILYPGAVEIDDPSTGGIISLTNAPWAVGIGTIGIAYRVMIGSSEVGSSLPYETESAAGTLVQVFADVTDDNGTTTVEVGSFTLAVDPTAPVLGGFAIDYDTDTVSFTSDIAATVTWRRYPPGHVFANQAAEVLAGTGAIDGGSYDIESGANSDAITFTGGISGPQELWIVARVGTGPTSNVIGGPVNITPAGTGLTAPNFRGSSIGGDASGTGVAAVSVPLPVYSSGDLVILPIGIDCEASLVAGVAALAPNGETVTVKQALTDNSVAGDDGQSIALLYYRATAANSGGATVTISVTPGGTKSVEQIVCTPVARFNVKASGDPFAQVVKTSSSTATLTVTTAALTAISAQSRIEACLISEFELPTGAVPEGWTLREVGRFGSQSIQTISRNAATIASESVGAVTLPLTVARRWVGLTWELLPLGA